MPARKKPKDKQTGGAANANSNTAKLPPASHDQAPETESEGIEDRPTRARPGSLKQFVEQFKDRHYYVIEMRIVLICCLGIFLKLFFSDVLAEAEDQMLTYSALIFVALCVVVIVFSTWLDYFPSRLLETEPRECKGQGMPMACLLLPMACCAQLYFALHFAQHLAGLLELYLIVLSFLSVCSILATLLHSIPHPNHMVFYNFTIIAGSYILQTTVGVSMWVVLPAAIVYTVLGIWLLNAFPKTFTLGEAMIVTQGITLLIVDTAIQILALYEVVSLPETLVVMRSESVLYVELLLLGVVICCVLLSPALYKLSEAKQYYERKFWSGTFILLSLSVGFMLVLPWLGQLLGGHNPIVYLFFYSLGYPVRWVLIVFWLMVCVLTGVLVWAQSSTSSWTAFLKASPMLIRKCLHFSALLVYLTGTALDPNFTAMASSLIIFFFVVAELGRICRMWPFGESLHQLLLPLLNNSDSGPALVSHLYLLLGFSLPLWLCPIRNYNRVVKFSMYSGSLSLGVGDAVASIVGKLYGDVNWPGTKKTIKGSLASLLAQLVAVVVIAIIDPQLPSLSARDWGIITGSIAITTALEAYTWQIDNLILPILQYAIVVTFLN